MTHCLHDTVKRVEINVSKDAIGAALGVPSITGWWCANCRQRFARINLNERIETDKALSEINRKFDEIAAQRDGLLRAQTCVDCQGLICPPMRCKTCIEKRRAAERLVANNRLEEAQELLRGALAALELYALDDNNAQYALSDVHLRIVNYAP